MFDIFHSSADVLINFRLVSLTEGVAFASTYNFSVKENEPAATKVGMVKASTGSSQVAVSYSMRSHEDVFSVDAEGAVKSLRPLDKEKEEWYILTVEATDSRTPPNTAQTTVILPHRNLLSKKSQVQMTQVHKQAFLRLLNDT